MVSLTKMKVSLIVSTFVILILTLAQISYASTWGVEAVNEEGEVGSYSSLALDSSGNPHISYLDGTLELFSVFRQFKEFDSFSVGW